MAAGYFFCAAGQRQAGSLFFNAGFIGATILWSLSGCTKDPVERCVDAQVAAFDQADKKDKEAGTWLYKSFLPGHPLSREEARAHAELVCLKAS